MDALGQSSILGRLRRMRLGEDFFLCSVGFNVTKSKSITFLDLDYRGEVC